MRTLITAAVLSVFLAGCGTDDLAPPVIAGLDVQDPGLVQYLEGQRKAAALAPTSSLLRGRLGMAYDANGFAQAAVTSYEQAQTLDPQDYRWPYLRAHALAGLERVDDALVAIEQALSIDDQQAPLWFWQAAWSLDLDDFETAEKSYAQAQAIAKEPALAAAAATGVARSLLRQDAVQQALEVLQRLAIDFPHPYVNQLLMTAFRRAGLVAEAQALLGGGAQQATPIVWIDEVQQEKSSYVQGFSGRMLIAQKLLGDDKPNAALAILETLKVDQPDDRDLLNNLSVAYKMLDRNDEAFGVLQEGLAAYPDFHLFHFNISVHYELREELELALSHLDRAIELDPALLAAYERKYALLVRKEDFAGALAVIDEANKYGTAQPKTLFNAALAAGAIGKWDVAIDRLRQALKINPRYPRAQLFYGRSLAEVGQFDEARDALRKAEQLGVEKSDITAALVRLSELRRLASE